MPARPSRVEPNSKSGRIPPPCGRRLDEHLSRCFRTVIRAHSRLFAANEAIGDIGFGPIEIHAGYLALTHHIGSLTEDALPKAPG
jgi:hypothetical protein